MILETSQLKEGVSSSSWTNRLNRGIKRNPNHQSIDSLPIHLILLFLYLSSWNQRFGHSSLFCLISQCARTESNRKSRWPAKPICHLDIRLPRQLKLILGTWDMHLTDHRIGNAPGLSHRRIQTTWVDPHDPEYHKWLEI